MPFWKLLFIIFDEAKLSLAYQKYHYMYLFIMISKDVGIENEVQILNTGYSSIHCFVVIRHAVIYTIFSFTGAQIIIY